MAATPIWITPAGDLGIIPELEYYEIPLDAYNTSGGELQFTLVAGSLPAGLELYDDGRILGIPVVGQVRGVPAAVNKVTTSTFTLRIRNIDNRIADRTFELTVAGIAPPIIVPDSSSLGTYVDGQYVDLQLESIEPNSLLTSTYSLLSGSLPDGVTLTSTGKISGYIRPVTDPSSTFAPGFDGFIEGIPDKTNPFDIYPFDAVAPTVNRNFQFQVQVSNGVSTDVATYTLFVYARAGLTADTTAITADNDSSITADTSDLYSPVIYTESGSLGSIRQNTNFAIQIDAEDYNSNPITYEISSGSLPTGLTLNTSTGWITGLVPYGSLGSVTYSFSVRVYKTGNPTYISDAKNYSFKILGQIDDTVIWSTASNMGNIYNGAISDLYISASTPSGRALTYTLDTIGGLPIGLELLSDGTISGRVSFETYGLDSGTLTIDGGLTTFDQKYTFTVSVRDTNNYVSDSKEFTITVVKRDLQPYENLYVQILPNRTQRELYDQLVNNSDILPVNYIYRQWDPWFGKNTLRRVLFMTGLNPRQVADYISAMELNHYWKTLNFGNVKTAQALDDNFNVIYEVVYIDLLDRQVNDQGLGPNLSVSLPDNSANISTIYPNSFPNMVTRLADNIGYENRSILPKWMTSRQPNGTVLGFTRALVLSYVIPGKGNEVAYRFQEVADRFNEIDFTIDRYEWDSILSNNFEKAPAAGTGNITANTVSNIVTGTGTIFSDELLTGQPIYVSNVSIGNIKTISSNTVLTLTANSVSNVSASAFTHGTNVFIVNNYTIASGNISASTTSNIITGLVSNISGNGTITGNTSSTTIIGTNTNFASQLGVGKQIYVSGNSIGTITRIISDTVLALDLRLSSNITSVAYTADGSTTKFINELRLGDTIVAANGAILGTVKTINSNTNLALYSNSLSTVSNVSFSHTTTDPYTTPSLGNQYLKFPQVNILV